MECKLIKREVGLRVWFVGYIYMGRKNGYGDDVFSGYEDGKVIVRGKTGLGVLGNRSMDTEMWSHA